MTAKRAFIDRVGNKKEFDRKCIENAIRKAAPTIGVKIFDLVDQVIQKLPEGDIYLETVQNIVIFVLMDYNKEIALKYAEYRQQRAICRNEQNALVNAIHTIEEYTNQTDWRVNENANQNLSLGGLILNVSGKLTAEYWLNRIYSRKIAGAHKEGDIHIHDLGMLAGYCAGWSLRTLLHEGFNGVPNTIQASPPRHLSSAIGQMINFLGCLQNEWAGAMSFSSFDTYLAPFVRKDSLPFAEIKQAIQTFIYCSNVPSRWGGQAVFSNITFDWICPEDLKQQAPVIGGALMPFTYGELNEEMDKIAIAFYQIMLEGDSFDNPFTFPIPTVNITPDFDWNSDKSNLMFECAGKYGISYFQNFISSSLKPHHVRSMCCRLQLNLNELLARGNGLFGSVEMTGSVGVVTINCARLGYLYVNDLDGLLARLDELVVLAKESLEIKRKTITRLFNQGLYPYTKRYLKRGFVNHFSTIGVNGINEMILNYSGGHWDITDKEGVEVAKVLLNRLRESLQKIQQETGHLYNLEATPAEGCGYRFAREDKKRFVGIIQAGEDSASYYTNSSLPPVDWSKDVFEILENQKDLQTLYTGGTVIHLYCGEKYSGESVKTLVNRIFSKYSIPYMTITPVFTVCDACGYLEGEYNKCPKCGSFNVVTWTRVVGYHRPVESFNLGRKEEHKERVLFELESAYG